MIFKKKKDDYPWLLPDYPVLKDNPTTAEEEEYNNLLKNYTKIKNFLIELDNDYNKTQYINLTVMDMQREIKGTIEGVATGGSVSVNGSSAIRRTGSLSLVALTKDTVIDEEDINNKITELSNIIYLNKLVFVEVGFTNSTTLYPDNKIIWFPQGLFVMAGANISKNNSGINISLTLKDQMCLLNGEQGGTFEAPITHSPIYTETVDTRGEYNTEYPLFKPLITTLVSEWGKFPEAILHIDEEGTIQTSIKNTIRWIGTEPVYIGVDKNHYYQLSAVGTDGMQKYEENDDIGYQRVPFTYPSSSDLTSNAGESITSVLDKIKNELGNYEYFFDIFGEFYFQKIKNFLYEGEAIDNLNDALQLTLKSYLSPENKETVYEFNTDTKLVASYSNAPAWQNIKNDFVVIGEDKDQGNLVKYHLIINEKPKFLIDSLGNNIEKMFIYLYTDYLGTKRASKYGSNTDKEVFLSKIDYVIKRLKEQSSLSDKDKTLLSNCEAIKLNPEDAKKEITLSEDNWRLLAYYQSIDNDLQYFYSKELIEELPRTIDIETGELLSSVSINYFIDIIDGSYIDEDGKMVFNNFIKGLWCNTIGKRTKAINDQKINCIFQPIPPDVHIYIAGEEPDEERAEPEDQIYQVPESLGQYLAIGTAHNSAYELIRAQIHTLLSFNDSVTINTIPIYHLEPNTIIWIEDEDTSVKGRYTIKSVNIPLTIEGTMSIQANKTIEMI